MNIKVTESPDKKIEVCYVEDDQQLREYTVHALGRYGYEARGFPGSREFYYGLLQRPCDIAILDSGLPGENGFTIATNLRASSDIGIIILTTDEPYTGMQRQAGASGADAYLAKPVEIRDLVAVLHSVARRLRIGQRESPTGSWSLTPDGWFLITPNNERISLTPSERSLLRIVMRELDLPISREALIEALGHSTDYYLPHRLDMLISRLRRKVLNVAEQPLPLKAVRGIGFAFSPEV